MYTHDLTVFVGRFQPFHEGHLSIIKKGLLHAPKIAVLIGSAFAARSYRNPLNFTERAAMIGKAVADAGIDPATVIRLPLEDAVYNDELWITKVRQQVNSISTGSNKVALIGHAKDHTCYYLDMFPEWDGISAPYHLNLSATQMRQVYFSNIGHQWLNDCDGHKEGDPVQDHLVPSAVRQFLLEFIDTPDYKTMQGEYEYIRDYCAPYMSLPYPPTFITADACIAQNGHILLVRRKNYPGKGLWAFPGGFVKQDQTILEAMLAELSEETMIQVDRDTLVNSIIYEGEYDDPQRDPRGRVITHGFLLHLKRQSNLPMIEAADDAAEAKWWPRNDIRRDMMALDHFDILRHLTARI